MGTHPIFESDFDCLTEKKKMSEGETSAPPRPSIIEYLKRDPITSIMFGLRIYTIFAGLMAILNPYSQLFTKVLMASAATNALRLHQRIPQLSISAQTLQNILAEDSGHYLAYSLMFMSGRQHAALILIPIIAFAIMHVSNFSNKIFAETSFSFAKGQQAVQYVRTKNVFLLQFIAMSEIFLMPLVIYFAFTGAGLFTPLIYYRFLVLRYSSERNPYNRTCFHQMRLQADQYAANPSTPGILKTLITKAQAISYRLAPQQQ